MNLDTKLHLEHQWHESEDFARNDSSLIVDVYASGVFEEAEAYHLDALGDVAGQHVLDYGCGTGGTTARLLARGAQVTGFDISFTRLQAAQARAAPAAFLECAAELLPFSDGAFDAVLGKQILHHLDLKLAVREIARVLRPGGRAVFLEPLIHNPLLEGYRRLTPHLRSPTEKALSMADINWMGSCFRSHRHRSSFSCQSCPCWPRRWPAGGLHRNHGSSACSASTASCSTVCRSSVGIAGKRSSCW